MTVGLPWSSVGLSTSYRGNPRVPRQGPRLSIVHGASTESATVVAMRRAAVLSVATSVVPTTATHGSTTATATAYSMATSIAVGVAVGLSVVPRPAAVSRGCLPWVAVEISVEIAVEIAMASAMGLHGVPLLATAFRGSPLNARGSPWSVRGSP